MNNSILEDLLDLVKNRYFGLYRGVVIDTADQTERGRLKVKVPSVLGDQQLWAMPCVPYAGDGVGFYAMPPLGTGVWLQFEGGDPSYPVWTGFFWADDQLPDESSEAIKIWKTDSLTLRLDDQSKEIMVDADDTARVVISDKVEQTVDATILTTDASGVVAASSGMGKVEVTSGGVNVNNGALEVT